MIHTLSFRVFKRFDFFLIFFEKRRVFEIFEFFLFFRRDDYFIFIFLELLKTIRNYMSFKQKIVNEINFFDKKIVKIVFDVVHISKKFDLEQVFFLKF